MQAIDKQAAVARWLADHLYGEEVVVSALRSPGVGASTEVYLVDARPAALPEAAVDPLVIRCQKITHAYYPDTDIGREYRVVRLLGEAGIVPVPEVFGHEPDATVLGAPFMVMRRVDGLIPEHRPAVIGTGEAAGKPSYNASGWVRDASPAERRKLWLNGLTQAAQVSRADPAAFGFLDRGEHGAPGLDQEIGYWFDYMRWATPAMLPLIGRAEAWLRAHRPPAGPPVLSWGDARLGNMIFRDFQCVAVIDWENVSLGGAEMDLGWWLTSDRWHGAAMGLERLEGLGSRQETLDAWAALTGAGPRHTRFFEIFGAYRLAGIVERGLHLKGGEGQRHNPALYILEELLETAAAEA